MKYDVIVIGAGPAGKKSSGIFAKAGKKVCLVEQNENHVGGTCLNEGCIPAKLYLESVSYLEKREYLKSCGLESMGLSFNIETLREKKCSLINQMRKGATQSITKSGIDLVFGKASFVDLKSIKVGSKIFQADKFIIATGSLSKEHPVLQIDKKSIITSNEVFELKKIPSSIVIVGGGAIGCEFATFFNALGSSVHIVEFTSSLLPAEDKDVSDTIKREFIKKGIKITLNGNISGYTKSCEKIVLDIETKKGLIKEESELVLVSIGRSPNTEGLSLEKASVKTQKGFIKVDDFLRTTNSNIFAIGDVIPTAALAHVAYNEAKVAAHNILSNSKEKPSQIIPFVTFSSPQVASIGAREKELREKNIEYKATKGFFKSNAKAKIKGFDGGFVKILSDNSTGVIIGGAMVGNDTTELIHILLVAINAKQTIDELKDMIFAHPTLSEALWESLNH